MNKENAAITQKTSSRASYAATFKNKNMSDLHRDSIVHSQQSAFNSTNKITHHLWKKTTQNLAHPLCGDIMTH